MMSANEPLWCPEFEGVTFNYAAFQVQPQAEELMGLLGGPVTTTFTAIGSALFDQAVCVADGRYTVSGRLDLVAGVGRLQIEGGGQLRQASSAATFEATCTPTAQGGATLQMLGWVYTDQPIANGRGRVIGIRGTIRETAPGGLDHGAAVFSMRRA